MTEEQILEGDASVASKGSKPCVVDVFARTRPDGSAEFSHDWRWEDGPSEGKGSIVIPKRLASDPGTPLHFHLRDETNPKRGFRFVEKQGAAMWVLRDACPPAAKRSDDSEIPPQKFDTTPVLLKAFNENSEECSLHYRLWFQDKDGKWDAYDPDIKNGGKV